MASRKAVMVCGLSLLATGCATPMATGPHTAAQTFYAAVDARDGRQACAVLSRATRETLEEEEQEPCRRAILKAQLDASGIRVQHVQPAITGAAVQLTNGEYVFLDSSTGRWEISAAGCKPAPDQSPFDCSVGD